MHLPFPLPVFAATRPGQIPTGICRFIGVDGTIPGAALTWDHHRTGESINLDAMPGAFDAGGYDGVATTSPDTDAAASVLAVMAGGKDQLPREARRLLEAASWRCDHLRAMPGATPEEDRRGHGLHAWVSRELVAAHHPDRSAAFASVCAALAGCLSREEPLPWTEPVLPEQAKQVAAVLAERTRIEGAAARSPSTAPQPPAPLRCWAPARTESVVFWAQRMLQQGQRQGQQHSQR